MGAGGLGLVALLIAAAAPARFGSDLPVVGSVSVLDIVVVALAVPLSYEVARTRWLETGYTKVLGLLAVPLVVSIASLLWTQDVGATLTWVLVYAEGLIVYLYVVSRTVGMSPEQIMRCMRFFVVLLFVPAGLMLAGAPGFEPYLPGFTTTSADYVGYYTRLSHPFIGRSNNFASVLAFFFLILTYMGAAKNDRRSGLVGMAALTGIVLTLSRGVLLSVAGVTAAYALVSARHAGLIIRRIALALAVLAVALAAFLQYNPVARDFLDTRWETANVEDRSSLAAIGLEKIAERPGLGYGAGVVPDGDARLEAGVHNTYLQQAIYFGIPLGVVVSGALVSLALFFFGRRRPGSPARAIGFSLVLQVLIFVSQSSFEGTVLRVLFYLSIGLAVGLLRGHEDLERGPAPQSAVARGAASW